MDGNYFDQKFKEFSQTHQSNEELRNELAAALNELNNKKRVTANGQSELGRLQLDVSDMKLQNQKKRETLMNCLIDRDQLNTKKMALAAEVEQLKQQLENLDNESNSMLNDDSIELAYERYSTANQLSLLNKLQEARCKLTNYEG